MTGIPILDAPIKRLMELDQASVFAIADIAAERVRQIDKEGWTPAHDNQHGLGEMAKAAAAYAIAPHTSTKHEYSLRPSFWPWGQQWWKPGSPHRNCVRAGALLVAELARHLRSAQPGN